MRKNLIGVAPDLPSSRARNVLSSAKCELEIVYVFAGKVSKRPQ